MKAMMNKFQALNFKQYWQPLVEQRWMPYYQSLAAREQRVLLFAAVVLPAMLFIFVILLPLNDAKNSKQIALQVLQKQVNEAERLAVHLQDKGTIQMGKENTMSVVDQVARTVQVRQFITRLRPQIGSHGRQRLLIQMRVTPYDKAVVFFEALSERGLSLMQVKFQQSEQQGFIHVQAVVE